MASLRELLLDAQDLLAKGLSLAAGEARIEAQVLMRRALGDVSRAWLMAHDHDSLPQVQIDAFSALLKRRLNGEPVAYILGEREFYGRAFSVSPDVLIPRPDTETLVEAALARIPAEGPCRVLDLGTGSGAIGIAIACERPHARVTAVDRSQKAVQMASENAVRLRVDNAEFQLSDWFSALENRTFDVIVSNPPYIAAADPHLNRGDLRFEPLTALASGPDGLDDIRFLAGAASGYLAPGGWLLFEHGYDQADRVAQLLTAAGFVGVVSVTDLAGWPRVTMGRINLLSAVTGA